MRGVSKTMKNTEPVRFQPGDMVSVSQNFDLILNKDFLPLYVSDPCEAMLEDLRKNRWSGHIRMPDVVKRLKRGDTAIIFKAGEHEHSFVFADGHFGWAMKSMLVRIDDAR